MKRRRVEPYVGRGALGGALGGLLAVVLVGILWAYGGLTEGLGSMLIVGFALALMGGAVTGLAVGYIIWTRAVKAGSDPHPVVRALIGVGVVLAWSLLMSILNGRSVPLAFSVIYAIVVGALPGLMARAKGDVDSGVAEGSTEGRA